MDLWRRLVDHWTLNGVAPPLPGVDPGAIVAFEQRFHVRLPADVRQYFLTTNGTGDFLDPALFSFWPLQRVKPLHEAWANVGRGRAAYPGCFVFADHSVRGSIYAVRFGENGQRSGPVFRVTEASNPSGEQVAPSFVEFVEQYLEEPQFVL